MPFFQPAFIAPVQADASAFANLFQLVNDIDGYQREASCESACKPKQQQQQQQQQQQRQQAQPKAQPKPQQKSQQSQQAQPKPQQTQQKRASFRHPFEEFFNSLQQAAAETSRAASLPTFHPRFDVRETENTYELHGELAGVDRNNISLEFTEPQTLVVSGKVERNYQSQKSTPLQAVPAVENTPEAIADTHSEPDHHDDNASTSGARTPVDEEFTEINSPRSPSPARSHRATVTDEETEEALERGLAIAQEEAKKAVVATPAPVAPAPAPAPSAPAERFWYQERAVGQFKRVFDFPVPVDEANVRASLDNGILSVSVPKVKREVRRIVVF